MSRATFEMQLRLRWRIVAAAAFYMIVFCVMVGGPLTGACFNPARWFGAALVSNEWGGVWPYLVGPLVGSLAAVAVWRFVIEAGGPAPTEPPQRVSPAAQPVPKKA